MGDTVVKSVCWSILLAYLPCACHKKGLIRFVEVPRYKETFINDL